MTNSDWWRYKAIRDATWGKLPSLKKIKDIDRQTIVDGKEFGLQQEEAIKFKQRQECKLFRCVVCWHIIHPTDDEIAAKGDGFAHKICMPEGLRAFVKPLTIQQRLDEDRIECTTCHHTKRAHVNGECAGVKTKGTASGNQKQAYWFCKCKEYVKGTRII